MYSFPVDRINDGLSIGGLPEHNIHCTLYVQGVLKKVVQHLRTKRNAMSFQQESHNNDKNNNFNVKQL